MGESEKKCVGCDLPLKMYSRLTINGDAYNISCLLGTLEAGPFGRAQHSTSTDQARPSTAPNTA